MNRHNGFARVVDEIDYLRAERSMLIRQGPHFLVIHGLHEPETECLPGEMVEEVWLLADCKRYPVSLSPVGLVVMDCFCRNRNKPLSVGRLSNILTTDPFYTRYGANSPRRQSLVMPARSSIKVYVQRIREQIAMAFQKARLPIDPGSVLSAEPTDSNSVAYKLRASVTLSTIPILSTTFRTGGRDQRKLR